MNMEKKIYIKITEATDCEGRKPYKFFAEAIVPLSYVTIEERRNIRNEPIYWVHLNAAGEKWFEDTYKTPWNGYFSLIDTRYNPNNTLEQYYNELKAAEDHFNYLSSLI